MKKKVIAKQISLPLSYLPHAAVQPNYKNLYYYSSPLTKKNLHSSHSNNVIAHITSNPDPTQTELNNSLNNDEKLLADHDSYYVNEIINLRL